MKGEVKVKGDDKEVSLSLGKTFELLPTIVGEILVLLPPHFNVQQHVGPIKNFRVCRISRSHVAQPCRSCIPVCALATGPNQGWER